MTRVNRRLWPEPLRPSLVREALMIVVAWFYCFFVVMNVWSLRT